MTLAHELGSPESLEALCEEMKAALHLPEGHPERATSVHEVRRLAMLILDGGLAFGSRHQCVRVFLPQVAKADVNMANGLAPLLGHGGVMPAPHQSDVFRLFENIDEKDFDLSVLLASARLKPSLDEPHAFFRFDPPVDLIQLIISKQDHPAAKDPRRQQSIAIRYLDEKLRRMSLGSEFSVSLKESAGHWQLDIHRLSPTTSAAPSTPA